MYKQKKQINVMKIKAALCLIKILNRANASEKSVFCIKRGLDILDLSEDELMIVAGRLLIT